MTSELYQWTKLENHPITVIELTGEIDSDKKTETIEKIALKGETQHVALIMENVTYINSRGCSQFISLHKAVEARGFHLYLVKISPAVTKVIESLGIDTLLHMKGGLDEAILEVKA